MRRAFDDQPPSAGPGRRVCGHSANFEIQPDLHINYAETVLPMRDGLPKFKDVPAAFGGSGEQMAE
jgi:hypothetical protein